MPGEAHQHDDGPTRESLPVKGPHLKRQTSVLRRGSSLLLVAMPGAPSSDALVPSNFFLLVLILVASLLALVPNKVVKAC